MKKTLLLLFITTLIIAATLFSGCNSKTKPDQSGDKPPLNPVQTDRNLVNKEVVLYFSDDQANYLVAEKRMVKVKNVNETAILSPVTLSSVIVKELIAGPQNQNLRLTVPPESKLLSVEIVDKVANVNFTEEIRTKHWGGSTGETMTIMSIVNSLTELEGIDKVQILIEGEKQDSLVGHWLIDEPIERDEKIIKK